MRIKPDRAQRRSPCCLLIPHGDTPFPASLAAIACLADAARRLRPCPPARQPPGDATRGEAYARAACAECHEVEPGVAAPPYAKAPSFSSIAATPGMTSMALIAWFVTSHPNMPNLIIPERDREDLLAYFAVLRAAQQAAPNTALHHPPSAAAATPYISPHEVLEDERRREFLRHFRRPEWRRSGSSPSR